MYAIDFPWKLRITAAMLGCTSLRELAASFRQVNQTTGFDIERAHKWIQGRALPRDPGVLADWAKVLGSARPPGWLAACPREAFLAEVAALSGQAPAALEARAMAFGRAGSGAARAVEAAPVVRDHYLCGAYLAYSHAWSPARRGQLIRGSLRLSPARRRGAGPRFAAEYREAIAGGPLILDGEAELFGRVLQATMRERANGGAPLFLSLLVPGRPAATLCGVMSGATFASADPEPSATRFAALRVEEQDGLDAGNGYLEPGSVPVDLAGSGLPAAAARALLDFLRAGFLQIQPGEHAALAAACDPVPA